MDPGTQAQPGTLYALLVGINDYPEPVPSLRGCVPDIEHVRDFLHERGTGSVAPAQIKTLLNAEATRQRVIDTFRSHLGQAKVGDVALFYFSGHGTQQPSPQEFWRIEPDHLDETLLCYDSRQPGSWDLADKELGQLIAGVADQGAHILVILDACHSGSGTRTVDSDIRVRKAPTDTRMRPLVTYYGFETLLKNVSAVTDDALTETNWLAPQIGRHIVISACRPEEEAKEQIFDGQPRGVLSYYLLQALQQNQAGLTYRDLYKQLKARVESRVSLQSPLIEATVGSDLGLSFLGGAVAAGRSYFTVSRNKQKVWTVDGGAVHGFQQDFAGERTLLKIYPYASEAQLLDSLASAVGTATVTQIGPGESTVSIVLDDGQAPDPETLFKAVVVATPLPPIAVTMHGDEPALELVRAVLQGTQTGTSSLLVREVREGEEVGERALQLTAERGAYRIRRSGDRYPLATRTEDYTPQSAEVVVGHLEHIARWLNILHLSNPTSRLSQTAVELAVFLVDPITEKEATEPISAAAVQLAYRQIDDKWISPQIKIRLRNTTSRTLYCCLLDLPETFGVFPGLLPGGSVALAPSGTVGDEVWANQNQPINLYIPPDFRDKGVTKLRDVLKLIVSTSEISGYWLQQSDLEVATRSGDPTSRAPLDDTLSRLMRRVFIRHIGQDSDQSARRADWQCQELVLDVAFPPAVVPLPTTATDRIALADGVSIAGHAGLRASARIVSQRDASRDIGNLALPPLLRDHPELAVPFALTTSRSDVPVANVLELLFAEGQGETYATVTPEQPLVLQVDTPLAATEGVLSFAFDGELFLPLGTYRRTAHGGTELRLERLPSPTTEGRKSLNGAVKIFFQKLLSDRMGVRSAYPRLALPTLTTDGKLSYDADAETIRTQVAAAQRIRLYIHGMIGDTEGMALSALSQGDGEHSVAARPGELVLTFDYESISTEIETTAQDLKRKLREVGLGPKHGKQFTIVAHSMGGLVVRWFIEQEGGNKVVQHLTMLGTPNGGSPWPTIQSWATTVIGIGLNFTSAVGWPAKVFGWLVAAIEAVDKPCDQMEPDSKLLRELAQSEPPGTLYTILVGNTSIIEQVRVHAGTEGEHAFRRLLERIAPQRLLHDITALAFFGEPNDIAVSVQSSTAVPDGFVQPEAVIEIPCDHLTYFTAADGLRALMKAMGL